MCALYFKESNVVFLGGVVLALGVERSNLHRRIALSVILTVGTNPRWLMLGFMQVGMLLSFWISNSGVTAMLIPIVEAVVDELFHVNLIFDFISFCINLKIVVIVFRIRKMLNITAVLSPSVEPFLPTG